MAHPKRKHSKSRSRKDRTHQRLTAPSLGECSQCHKLKITHTVCPFCGFYAGKEIIKMELKESKKKPAN